MYKYLPLFLIIAIFGCGSENEKNERSIELEFSFTVDTVSIDPGEHLFYLAHNIPKVKLSPDEQFLYYFDDYSLAVDKVDLKSNTYALSIPLEKEGPKGIGSGFDYVPNADGSLAIFTQKNMLHLDEKGVLLSAFPLKGSSFGLEREKQFFRYASISDDQRYFFGLTSSIRQEEYLGWIDRDDSTYHEVKPDSMAYTDDLTIDFGGIKIVTTKQVEYLNSKIVLFHTDGIDTYSLAPGNGNWEYHDNNPILIDKRKAGNYPKTGELETGVKILEQKSLEVYYQPLVFDPSSKLYYRFATKKRENQVNGSVPDQFLIIFSEDFELIHEEDFSDYPVSMFGYFVREGKFWVRNTETEELEFFVFDFELKCFEYFPPLFVSSRTSIDNGLIPVFAFIYKS